MAVISTMDPLHMNITGDIHAFGPYNLDTLVENAQRKYVTEAVVRSQVK